MRRYGKIFNLLMIFSFKKQLAYRTSFFIAMTGKFLRIGIYIAFFESVLLVTDVLGGFGREAIFVHFFLAFVIFLIAATFFQRNLVFKLSSKIRDGDLDGMLVKPIHPLFHVAFYEGDFFDTVTLLPMIGLLAYAVSLVPGVTAASLALFLASIVVALVFMFALSTLFSSISFTIIKSSGIGRILHALFRSAQYPSTAFGDGWSVLFGSVLPIGFIATVPTLLLTGAAGLPAFAFMVVFTAALFIVAIVAWMKGLNRYSSASS